MGIHRADSAALTKQVFVLALISLIDATMKRYAGWPEVAVRQST
jgi:hypothetical protein